MSLEAIFSTVSTIALLGWLALLASPWAPVVAQRIATLVVPLTLSMVYLALVLAFWSRASGGFDSLDNVARLFGSREILLAGWIHYLAFDLLIGAWEARTARAEGIPFLLTVPCLLLTFLFGPIGFLAFSALRAGRAIRPAATP